MHRTPVYLCFSQCHVSANTAHIFCNGKVLRFFQMNVEFGADSEATHLPVKYSMNSCSSFMALSNVFLPCSSVSLLFISLWRHQSQRSCSKEKSAVQPHPKWCSENCISQQLCHSHDVLHRFRFDEHGDGIQLGVLEPLDGVTRDIQDAVLALQWWRDKNNLIKTANALRYIASSNKYCCQRSTAVLKSCALLGRQSLLYQPSSRHNRASRPYLHSL